MKTIWILILSFCWLQGFGQNLDSLFSKAISPGKLLVAVSKDTITLDSFPGPTAFTVSFTYRGISTYYYAFQYDLADATAFRTAATKYYMAAVLSDCPFTLNKDWNKNFIQTFVRGEYYFLQQRCQCQTGIRRKCARLAYRVNNWIRDFAPPL